MRVPGGPKPAKAGPTTCAPKAIQGGLGMTPPSTSLLAWAPLSRHMVTCPVLGSVPVFLKSLLVANRNTFHFIDNELRESTAESVEVQNCWLISVRLVCWTYVKFESSAHDILWRQLNKKVTDHLCEISRIALATWPILVRILCSILFYIQKFYAAKRDCYLLSKRFRAHHKHS